MTVRIRRQARPPKASAEDYNGEIPLAFARSEYPAELRLNAEQRE